MELDLACVGSETRESRCYVIRAARRLAIKRTHGLGNVICLLPVLDHLVNKGFEVTMIVASAWVETLQAIRPRLFWTSAYDSDAVDLDAMTVNVAPMEHRTDELARLLGIHEALESPKIDVPIEWSEAFEGAADSIIFAPEGGHRSRCWPEHYTRQLKSYLLDEQLIVVGTESQDYIPCDIDTRGQLELTELLGLLSQASVVISMDSGVLHLATALRKPTVALFGGIDPRFRIRPDQPAVALRADLACCPCNKQERCGGRYSCIRMITPEDVIEAVQLVRDTDRRVIMPVTGVNEPAALPLW